MTKLSFFALASALLGCNAVTGIGEYAVGAVADSGVVADSGLVVDSGDAVPEDGGCALHPHREAFFCGGVTEVYVSCLPSGDVKAPATYTPELLDQEIAHLRACVEKNPTDKLGPAASIHCDGLATSYSAPVTTGEECVAMTDTGDASIAYITWCRTGSLVGRAHTDLDLRCPLASDIVRWW